MSEQVLLIGDIGGTNARFALAQRDTPGFTQLIQLQCKDYGSPESAIAAYLSKVGGPVPAVICLAAAGPIVDDGVRFTNNDWHLTGDNLLAKFGTPQVRLLNDFEAIAHALPLLGPDELMTIGGVAPPDLTGDFSICVIGPGTGLGAGGLIRRDDASIGLVTEAGHVGFAPESHVQREILEVLSRHYGRISNERVASGMGVENIYRALGASARPPHANAAAIFERARDGEVVANQTLGIFFEILGQVAGDVVLSMGAFDGAYVAGGVAQRYPEAIRTSRFRQGFENKGRHGDLMKLVPSQLIVHPQPGLLGAAAVAYKM